MLNVNNCNNVNGDQFYIQLTNSGFYVAWYSVTYTINGVSTTVHSDNILIGGTRRLYFPKNVDAITILVEEMYFIGIWSVLDKEDFFLAEARQNRCYICVGASFLPSIFEVACTDSLEVVNAMGLQLQNNFLMNNYYPTLSCSSPSSKHGCNTCNLITNVNTSNNSLIY